MSIQEIANNIICNKQCCPKCNDKIKYIIKLKPSNQNGWIHNHYVECRSCNFTLGKGKDNTLRELAAGIAEQTISK